MNQTETELLARISREQERISQDLHTLSRRRSILAECATRLRTGESQGLIEARLEKEDIRL